MIVKSSSENLRLKLWSLHRAPRTGAPHLDAALGLAPELAAAAAAQLLDLLLDLGLVVIPDTGDSNSNRTFNSGYTRVLMLVLVFKGFRMIYLV